MAEVLWERWTFIRFIPAELQSHHCAVSYSQSPPPARPAFGPCTQSKIRRVPVCRSRPSICGQGLWRRGPCRGSLEFYTSPCSSIAKFKPQMDTDGHGSLKLHWHKWSAAKTFDLDSVFAKVKVETHGKVSCLQVIDALCLMDFVKIFHGLQLNQNEPFDRQVGYVISHDNSVIFNGDGVLLYNFKAGLSQFVHHRVLVNFLEKAASQ